MRYDWHSYCAGYTELKKVERFREVFTVERESQPARGINGIQTASGHVHPDAHRVVGIGIQQIG